MCFYLIDDAISRLEGRFTDSMCLRTYFKLENILTTGKVKECNHSSIDICQELNREDLQSQLRLFRKTRTCNSLKDAARILQTVVSVVQHDY